jgi:hypothetical protein
MIGAGTCYIFRGSVRVWIRRLYFRAPRRGFFRRDCRSLADFRLGLLMMNVPLP